MHPLSTSLPYLLTRLGVRMGDLFAQAVRAEGMTLPIYRVLSALSEQRRPLRLNELAVLVAAETSTLSRLVAAMARKGMLHRERPDHDQRSLQVTLTPHGQELAARFMPIAAHYEEVATGRLARPEIIALKATLRDLYDNLDRLEAEIASGAVTRLLDEAVGRGRDARPSARRRSPSRSRRGER